MQKVRSHMSEGICISAVTLAELEYGAAKSAHVERNSDALRRFLSVFDVSEFDGRAAACYGAVRTALERKGTPIGPLDTLIAAHALANGQTLVTNNIREFERVVGLTLENWTM